MQHLYHRCEYVTAPLIIMTGCATYYYCNQTLQITGKQSFTSLWKNFGPRFFVELLSFSITGRLSSMNCPFNILQQHLNGVQVRTMIKPFQNRMFVSFAPFRGGFYLASWIVVLLHNPVVFEFQLTD